MALIQLTLYPVHASCHAINKIDSCEALRWHHRLRLVPPPRSLDSLEDANFWPSSPQASFKALQPGELFLFKLHAPRNFIVGGGFFTRFLPLPLSLAWAAFGEANGARSLEEVRTRIGKYRKHPIGPTEDPHIGCILLGEPFFFEDSEWILKSGAFRIHSDSSKKKGSPRRMQPM